MWLSIFSTESSKNKYYVKKKKKPDMYFWNGNDVGLCLKFQTHLKHEDISWLSAPPTPTHLVPFFPAESH